MFRFENSKIENWKYPGRPRLGPDLTSQSVKITWNIFIPSVSQLFQGVTSGPLPIAQYYIYIAFLVFVILSQPRSVSRLLVETRHDGPSVSGVIFADCLNIRLC